MYLYTCSDMASLFQEKTSLPKSCLVVHIFSLTIMNYSKMLIGIKSLIQNNSQIDYLLPMSN